MGPLDTMKMIRKAQKAKSMMKDVNVAGKSKSGSTAILLNGLNEILEIHFEEGLLQGISGQKLEREIIEAYDDARKELEKELAANMDMDSLRDMFST